MHWLGRFLLIAALSLPASAGAQTATDALAALWNTICATTTEGTLLFQRCDETLHSPDPLSNLMAASGQHLEDLPGQARIGGSNTATASASASIANLSLGNGLSASLEQTPFGDLGLGLADTNIGGGWSLFASARSARLDHDGTRFESAFHARNSALTLGVDRRLDANWVFGAALHHARDRVNYADSSSRLDSRQTALLLFLDRSWTNGTYASAQLGAGRGSADILRQIRYSVPTAGGTLASIDTVASASPDLRQQQAGITLGWLGRSGGWDIDLGGGIDFMRNDTVDYDESGGNGLALHVAQAAVTQRIAHADARFGRTVSTGFGVWLPSLALSWQHALSDSARRSTIRFVEDPQHYAVGFDAQPDDRNWGEVALSSSFVFTHGHSGFIEYRQRFGHAFLDQRLLTLGWRIELD